jgi:signal transduction histidine kinase/CheY-like chemotaxis protein/HPt (histidine-containing phosphotransfer) domain-containing protein
VNLGLGRLSIGRKLTAIAVLTSMAALLVCGAVLLVYHGYTRKAALLRELAVHAEILATNSAAALSADDDRAATQVLGALAADPRITSALLQDRSGRPFARYVRANTLAADDFSTAAEPELLPRDVDLRQAIVLAGERIGTLLIHAELLEMYDGLERDLAVILGVVLLSGIGAALLASRLQTIVSGPVHRLVATMREVGARNDYSRRAAREQDDEVGALIDGFNEMLERVEERDRELQDARDHLETRVTERTADLRREIAEHERTHEELRRATAAAEAATRAKSEFLANMSHEIRTPMNAVIGMAQLLVDTKLDADQREYAETIVRSGEALLTIINDILDFSKMESGKLTLDAQPFELRECVEESLDLVASQAGRKGLDLAYQMDDDVPAALVGDMARLRQILLNLLNNAIKFTDAGEVVLGVAASRLPDGRHELRFDVRDTGIGIPSDRMDRLFRSFSQVDGSTTRRYGGTGLGLAISKRLAELMAGRMWVESEPGRGSTFSFTIVAAAAPTAPVARGRDADELAGKAVLVVDDNATNRRILVTQTRAWGMKPHAVASPLEALDLVRAGSTFDLAILDMQMPEMDGAALATALARDPRSARLPLVMLTSVGRRDAMEVPVAAFLTKPIKPAQLQRILVRVLAGAASADVPTGGEAAAAAPARSLRVLLAEDNLVNQRVGLRLLERLGYRADVAANGVEVLAALERQPYDVVLMDMQMPEMDGVEATRRIRATRPRPAPPRIVAMTANAMAGDREACLEAGMDDYIAKPVRLADLRAALDRCVAAPAPEPAALGGGAPAGANDADIDTALDALREGADEGFVAHLVAAFGDDAAMRLAAIRDAIAARDAGALTGAAHALKGSSASLGASGLAALCARLEASGRAGALEGTADVAAATEAECRRVLDVCRARVATGRAAV